jgi:hypothetical protein
LLYLQGQVALADLRAARAKQRLIESATAANAAQAEGKSAEADLKTARTALSVAEQKQRSLLATKGR